MILNTRLAMKPPILTSVTLLVFIFSINEIYSAFSGLYVDNGKGQTVVERFISRREKQKFEREMLSILGLSRKPRKVYNSTELNFSAPRFLMDIYNSLDGNEIKEFNLKNEDIRSVEESDTIVTFLSHSEFCVHRDKLLQVTPQFLLIIFVLQLITLTM